MKKEIMFKEIEKLIQPYFSKGQTEADITAVLKYIEDKNKFKTCLESGLSVYTKGDFLELELYGEDDSLEDGEEYEILGLIPYKPLHLYTEQENILLLKLLKKLGTKKKTFT